MGRSGVGEGAVLTAKGWAVRLTARGQRGACPPPLPGREVPQDPPDTLRKCHHPLQGQFPAGAAPPPSPGCLRVWPLAPALSREGCQCPSSLLSLHLAAERNHFWA